MDPSRISVAGGSVTEILYALGAGDQIVGADRTSNYPPEALELPQIGYVRNLSAEGVLSLSPTLVLGEDDMGPPDVVAQLERVGLPVIAVPEAFTREGVIAKVRCVASVVGRVDAGEQLIRERLLGEDVAAGSDASRGLVILTLTEGAPIAAGRDTSGEGFLALAGATNALSFNGWKPVSAEAMAAAAPEFIVITERGLQAAGGLDGLLDHPALRLTPAAAERKVLAMDGMAMLGFGLRTLETADRLRAFLDDEAADNQVLSKAH
ncbi:MAG: ABC transporter substrate-binding protein [Pseudomonadota bacterium]